MTDVPVLSALLAELFAIEQDFSADAEKQQRGLKLLLASSQAQVFVAEHSGTVVGMVCLQKRISTAAGGEVAVLEDLVVTAAQRGQGIGRALLQQAQQWATTEGLLGLQLLADKENYPALLFYQQAGWETTHLLALRYKS